MSAEFILTLHECKAGAAMTVLERTAGGDSTQKGMVALHLCGSSDSMSATSESNSAFSALSRKSSIAVVKNSLSKLLSAIFTYTESL